MTRDEYGRFVRLYTPEEHRERNRIRMEKRRREEPELYRRLAREAQRRRRKKLAASLARPHVWKLACSLCLQFGHKRSWCPLLPNERDAR